MNHLQKKRYTYKKRQNVYINMDQPYDELPVEEPALYDEELQTTTNNGDISAEPMTDRIDILNDVMSGGNIRQREQLPDPNERTERLTTPYMTKYERARVLGTRALQIR